MNIAFIGMAAALGLSAAGSAIRCRICRNGISRSLEKVLRKRQSSTVHYDTHFPVHR